MAGMSFQNMSDTGIDLMFALAEVKTLTEEVKRLKKENRTLRNELCQRCGQYREQENAGAMVLQK